MKNRILALLLALCMLLSAVPVYAGAATAQQVSANAVTVTAGNTASVTLKAENFSGIAALDVYVYYDASVFTVSSTSNGTLLSGAQASVNTAEAGKITLSLMSLNGISGSGNLLTVRFATTASTAAGTYPVTVAIGRAYDSSLQAVEVGGVNGSVTVNEPVETEKFTLYGYPSTSSLQKGSVLSYRVASTSSSRSFVSGEFTVTYDHEVFAFESATLESALTGEGAIYSVNSSVLGQVRIVYANDDPVKSFYLFTVKLKVIADMDGKTTVKAEANNMYRENLSAYLPGSCSSNLTLTKLPQVQDYPNAFLRTDTLVVGRQSKSDFCLEAGAGVAAADFTLTYDPAVLSCVSVTQAEGLADVGGMVVINDNFQNGTIRFSYVNMDAYAQEDLPLVQITWEPVNSPSQHYGVALQGVGVVDAAQKPITLEYVTDTNCIYVATVVPPCEADGYTLNTCACGKSFQDQFTPMEGHILQEFEAKEPTCLEPGWTAHVGCTRCDYKTVELLPALGHDIIYHSYQAPTCTEVGWLSYSSCSRCDFNTYSELQPLGHRTFTQGWELADPFYTEDAGDYPFEYVDGVYYSTNHGNSTTSELVITAQYDCEITLIYGVSSEQGWDKLYIYLNWSESDMISGDMRDCQMSYMLSAGDTLSIRYSKDGSVSNGEDRGWVQLQYEQVYVETMVEVPSEQVQPTCTTPVVCSYCNVVVKETSSHMMTNLSGTQPYCELCGQAFAAAIWENGQAKQVYKTVEQAYAACGENQFIWLLCDAQVNMTLTRDLYIDLNGRAMTGTIQTGDYKIYGLDYKTNMGENSNGYFACTDQAGQLLSVEQNWHTPALMTGVSRSYLALRNESGWTFNYYSLKLTHVSLKPNVSGVGYKGCFVSNPAVCAALSETDTFGYTLSLEGGLSVTRSIDGYTSGRIVTLRVDNFDVQNYGEAMLSAKVFLTLKDGTVLESSEVSMSMRMILEDINARYASFTAEQMAAVKAMIEKYPIVKTWDTANLYA